MLLLFSKSLLEQTQEKPCAAIYAALRASHRAAEGIVLGSLWVTRVALIGLGVLVLYLLWSSLLIVAGI